jgi:hypothetical protein
VGGLLERDPELVARGAKAKRGIGSSAIQSGSSGRFLVMVRNAGPYTVFLCRSSSRW